MTAKCQFDSDSFVSLCFVMSPKLVFRKKVRARDGIVLQDLADAITLEVKSDRKDRTKLQSAKAIAEKNTNAANAYNCISTDIWFSIAEFIDPEDVRNFALICRDTAFIVTTAKFWLCLYRRFYKRKNHLPDDLEESCLSNVRSLRSKVIRALFYLHPPLIERIKTGYDISFVHGYRYLNSWYRKESNVWLFCYKLWNSVVPRRPREDLDESDSEDADGLSKALNKLNNVFENPHEGISLLVIYSRRYIPFPALHGSDMILYSTRQPIASDLKSTNLELKFIPFRQSSALSVDVVYFSILKYKVYPWWHPDYKVLLFNEHPQLNC